MTKYLTWAKGRPITWADAELVCPGIEAEWRSMLGTKIYTETTLDGRTVRLPSPAPPLGHEWRLELHDDVRDNFNYSQPESPYSWMVEVIQLDPTGRWWSPPCWRRWPDRIDPKTGKTVRGTWTAPMGVPKLLLVFEPIVYRPMRPVHYITIDAEIGTSGSVEASSCPSDCDPAECNEFLSGRCRGNR